MNCLISRSAYRCAPKFRLRCQWRRVQKRDFAHSCLHQSCDGNSEAKQIDVEKLLSKPTWSVASLLPTEGASLDESEVTPKQLNHLLRLSALPTPKDKAKEDKMLSTLSSQLHFVKEIQKIDTQGVEPLRSLRDETPQGEREAELGLDALQNALQQEEVRGKHHKRIRRRRNMETVKADWDVLGSAERKVGRYFVVDGGKGR